VPRGGGGRAPRHAPSRSDHTGRPPAGDGGRHGVHAWAPGTEGARGGSGGGDRRWRRPGGGVRHSRGDPERHRAGDPRRCGARMALDAATGAGVGVHEPHGAADRDRGWEPLGRGRRRHHGAHPQDSSRDRCLSRQRIHRRGDPRGARRVRGGLAPQRGGRVMTRRGWAIAILGAWAASLGWLVKREFFRPTGTLLAGPDSETTHVPLARPIVLPTLLPLRLAFGGELKRGKTYASVVFDPILLAERPVTVLVAAESTLVVADSAGYDSTALAWVPAHFDTVRAFRIEQREGEGEGEGGMTTRAWIDAQGHVVRAENAVGFVMERTAFELAYTNFRHRDTTHLIRASVAPGPGDVVATTMLAARARLPHDTLSLFRVQLRGVATAALDLGGGRQQLSGDTLVIRRETRAALAARYSLPARDSSLAHWLAPAPLIQSDDPRLQAQARLIIGREQDPARAARGLAAWVRAHVKRQSTAVVPSGVRVLEIRVGDCNEHAVLVVALAPA